jgi:hypothetical protein
MLRIPYGKDLLVKKPLLSTADYGSWLTSTPTLAAGDVTVKHNRLAPANCAFKTVAFTSGGTFEWEPGQTITGATSGATAVIIGFVLTSGTFAGGDAAGVLVVRSDSGTFQVENLNVGANTNVATIGGALGASGVPAFANGEIVFGVPGSQLLGASGTINIKDATATEEWQDDGFDFITEDHPRAGNPAGCLYAGVASSVSGTTLTGEASADGIAHPLSADAAIAANLVALIEDADTGAGQAVPIASFVHATRVFTLRHAFPLTPTGTVSYKVYALPIAPANVIHALNQVLAAGGSAPSGRVGVA